MTDLIVIHVVLLTCIIFLCLFITVQSLNRQHQRQIGKANYNLKSCVLYSSSPMMNDSFKRRRWTVVFNYSSLHLSNWIEFRLRHLTSNITWNSQIISFLTEWRWNNNSKWNECEILHQTRNQMTSWKGNETGNDTKAFLLVICHAISWIMYANRTRSNIVYFQLVRHACTHTHTHTIVVYTKADFGQVGAFMHLCVYVFMLPQRNAASNSLPPDDLH